MRGLPGLALSFGPPAWGLGRRAALPSPGNEGHCSSPPHCAGPPQHYTAVLTRLPTRLPIGMSALRPSCPPANTPSRPCSRPCTRQALIDFENVLGLEPKNFLGDDFSRVTQARRAGGSGRIEACSLKQIL